MAKLVVLIVLLASLLLLHISLGEGSQGDKPSLGSENLDKQLFEKYKEDLNEAYKKGTEEVKEGLDKYKELAKENLKDLPIKAPCEGGFSPDEHGCCPKHIWGQGYFYRDPLGCYPDNHGRYADHNGCYPNGHGIYLDSEARCPRHRRCQRKCIHGLSVNNNHPTKAMPPQ